jgi:hypothetical protein
MGKLAAAFSDPVTAMDTQMKEKQESVHALVEALSTAIWKRQLEDKSFDFLEHFLNPLNYRPVTPPEIHAWESLTHPDRHEELAAFVNEWRRLPASGYALAIGSLLLLESHQRRSGKIQ